MATIKAGTYKFKDSPILQALRQQALRFTCTAESGVTENWYFIEVSTSQIAYNNEDADYPQTAYSNGVWNSTYSFRQTIALATDQSVSDEFYTWFKANIELSLHNQVEQFISDAYDAVVSKQGTIPTQKNLANLAGAIGTISTGVDTSDATATSADILKNKTAYVKGTKVTGAIETYDGSYEDVSTIVQIPVTKTADNYSKISGLNKSKVYTVFWENELDVPEAKFIIRYQNGSWTNVESQTEDSATFYVNSGSYWTSWRNGAVYEADKELTVDDFWSPTTGYTTLTNSFTQTMAYWLCIVEGTLITLADGTKKPIEQITYDDELLVWNFYEGKFDVAKPCWIKIPQVAHEYNLCKFSNGAEVGFVGEGGNKGYHRIYNDEAKAFTHTGVAETPIGTTTFAEDMSMPTLVEQEVVKKEVKYYNIITDKHYNLFANGILTSCKLSNKYTIENMKYVGERLITDEEERAYFEHIENIKA